MHDEDIVCLATAVNPTEAHLWREALEEHDIHCRVVGDYLHAGLGDPPGARPEIWVHREDAERARAILEDRKARAHFPGEKGFGPPRDGDGGPARLPPGQYTSTPLHRHGPRGR